MKIKPTLNIEITTDAATNGTQVATARWRHMMVQGQHHDPGAIISAHHTVTAEGKDRLEVLANGVVLAWREAPVLHNATLAEAIEATAHPEPILSAMVDDEGPLTWSEARAWITERRELFLEDDTTVVAWTASRVIFTPDHEGVVTSVPRHPPAP